MKFKPQSHLTLVDPDDPEDVVHSNSAPDTSDGRIKTRKPSPKSTGKSKPSAASMESELTRPTLATLLAGFKTPDGKPKYGMIQGKPVIFIDVKTVLTDESEKFQDKLLCDGLIFNSGDTCVSSCTFCYVPEAMIKLHKDKLDEFNRETGLNLDLSQVVIRRRGFLDVLKKQLLKPDGSRIYDYPHDHRVLYSSTLVDGLLARLEQADSPVGEKSGIIESHLRPVLETVPEELQVECWKNVTENIPAGGKLTATHVKKEAKRFLKKKGIETKKKIAANPDNRAITRTSLTKLEADLSRLMSEERYRLLLDQLLDLIEDASTNGESAGPGHEPAQELA